MPEALRKCLADTKTEVRVIANPPYAESSSNTRGEDKKGATNSVIRNRMHAAGLGSGSMDLVNQFFYRIAREFRGCRAVLFSPKKIMCAPRSKELRDTLLMTLREAYIVNAKRFGTKASWGLMMGVYDIDDSAPLSSSEYTTYVLNNKLIATHKIHLPKNFDTQSRNLKKGF